MTASVIELADAVVATLSQAQTAGTIDGLDQYAIVRGYAPRQSLADIEGQAAIDVVPKSRTSELSSRAHARRTFDVDVLIRRRVESPAGVVDQLTADVFLALAADVADLFEGNTLPAVPMATCVGFEHRPIFDPVHLNEQHQLTTLIRLRFLAFA